MGRYIDDILQPGEKVLYSTNAHWIFYWPAIVAWIVALALFDRALRTGAPARHTHCGMPTSRCRAAVSILSFRRRTWPTPAIRRFSEYPCRAAPSSAVARAPSQSHLSRWAMPPPSLPCRPSRRSVKWSNPVLKPPGVPAHPLPVIPRVSYPVVRRTSGRSRSRCPFTIGAALWGTQSGA